MTDMETLKILQETAFWQALNNQLHDMKGKSLIITDDQHDVLKAFCFDNSLYEKINQKEYLDDISIALCTDLQDIAFLAPHQNPWLENIIKIFQGISPAIMVLNIEQALADAFIQIQRQDKKYKLSDKTPAEIDSERQEDDDDELYEFINLFGESKRSAVVSFSDIVTSLFDIQSSFLQYLTKQTDWEKYTRLSNQSIVFDTTDHKDHESIQASYNNLFRSSAKKIVSSINNRLTSADWIVTREVFSANAERTHNPRIEQYLLYELNLHEEEDRFLRTFADNFINSTPDPVIPLVNTDTFTFLEFPFPVITL
jgi:hypothetical protein